MQLPEFDHPVSSVTVDEIEAVASTKLYDWLDDPKNRRAIPHRFEAIGYTAVRHPDAKDGYWVINGRRQTVYCRANRPLREQIASVEALVKAYDDAAAKKDLKAF